MADYTLINWQDRGSDNTGKPRISAANLNQMEAAIKDAAEHHRRGTRAARPAAAAANKNWLYYATDNAITYLSDGVTWTAIGWTALRVQSLPTSPAPEDGQRVDYVADAAAGVIWPLRYNAASASPYKWETAGQPVPLQSQVDAAQGTTSAAFTDLATVGPSITLPLAGDYDIRVEAGAINPQGNGQGNTMSYTLNGGAVNPNDGIGIYLFHATARNDPQWGQTKTRRALGLLAGLLVRAKYQSNGGSNTVYSQRTLWATPVRVG